MYVGVLDPLTSPLPTIKSSCPCRTPLMSLVLFKTMQQGSQGLRGILPQNLLTDLPRLNMLREGGVTLAAGAVTLMKRPFCKWHIPAVTVQDKPNMCIGESFCPTLNTVFCILCSLQPKTFFYIFCRPRESVRIIVVPKIWSRTCSCCSTVCFTIMNCKSN